jgi:hypothetical protein
VRAPPHVQQSDISLTGADHSYELSLLMEIFDEGLDEGRLRNSLGALQATWDNYGVVFSLIKPYYGIVELLVFRGRIERRKHTASLDELS